MSPETVVDSFAEGVPSHRLGLANDVAVAAVMLTRLDTRYIHGEVLVVDGGWSIWQNLSQR